MAVNSSKKGVVDFSQEMNKASICPTVNKAMQEDKDQPVEILCPSRLPDKGIYISLIRK